MIRRAPDILKQAIDDSSMENIRLGWIDREPGDINSEILAFLRQSAFLILVSEIHKKRAKGSNKNDGSVFPDQNLLKSDRCKVQKITKWFPLRFNVNLIIFQ